MTLRTMERQIEALEQQDDLRRRAPVFLHSTGDGHYTHGAHTFDEEAVDRMINDLFRTTPIFLIPSEEEAAEGVWKVYESDQTVHDLRVENEQARRNDNSAYEKQLAALAECPAGLHEEPGCLGSVIARVRAEGRPERTHALLAVVETGLARGVDFVVYLHQWLGYGYCDNDKALLDRLLTVVEAYPEALSSYLLMTGLLVSGGWKAEARRLVLAACRNEELIYNEDLTDHTDVVPFLLKLCHAQPAETEVLREAIGTHHLLRHYACFYKLDLDFDVDLL